MQEGCMSARDDLPEATDENSELVIRGTVLCLCITRPNGRLIDVPILGVSPALHDRVATGEPTADDLALIRQLHNQGRECDHANRT